VWTICGSGSVRVPPITAEVESISGAGRAMGVIVSGSRTTSLGVWMAERTEPVGAPDVRVLPGVPDQPLPPGVEVAYPGDSFDIVKILEERGLSVEWAHPVEERTTLEHKAADVWIPVLAFVSAVGAQTCGSLLASVIEDYLGERQAKSSRLHVEFERHLGRKVDRFKATGRGEEVLEAMRRFDEE
jgi:hypothetical protein